MNGIIIPLGLFSRLIDDAVIAEVNDGVDKANAFGEENDCKPYQRKDCRKSYFRHRPKVLIWPLTPFRESPVVSTITSMLTSVNIKGKLCNNDQTR